MIGHSAGLARAQGCSLAREREALKTNAFQTMREKSESRGSKRAPEHAAERDVKLDWIETVTADFPGNLVYISSGRLLIAVLIASFIGMEDAHSLHLSLPPGAKQGDKNNSAPEQPAGSSMTNIEGDDAPAFFGVFDGHGGSAVAKFTGTTIHERLAALDSYSE